MKRRVALYGGSFNPVHWGHVRLAGWVVKQGLTDEVWLMVSPCNPQKAQASLLPEKQRLDMARLATEGVTGVTASDFEFRLPRPSYTWRTLEALRAEFPDVEFSLLIGADNWLRFGSWMRPDDILRRHRLLVYPRPGYPLDTHALPVGVVGLDAPVFDVSSTQIRQMLHEQRNVSDYLPPGVLRYITENGLYA